MNQPDNWYKSWFSTQDYLDLYKHRDSVDAQKIVNLILNNIKLEKDAHILDLACGNGRHSILFAKKGYYVTGIDLSRFLINQANERLKDEYLKHSPSLKFEIKDMRDIGHKNEFDLVINIFTSFGYFKRDEDNEMVIKSVSESLKHGGYFLLDFFNPVSLAKSLVPFNIKKYNSKVIVQIRNLTDKFVVKDILIFKNSPSGETPEYEQYRERIRLYSLEDFGQMFRKFGLELRRTFGGYDAGLFDRNTSGRLIILAQKV